MRRALREAAGLRVEHAGLTPRSIAESELADRLEASRGRALAAQGYLADRPLALAVHLAIVLEQPLLLEGEAGVGKTEVARALAAAPARG